MFPTMHTKEQSNGWRFNMNAKELIALPWSQYSALSDSNTVSELIIGFDVLIGCVSLARVNLV